MEKGRTGETLAVRHLKNNGYEILDLNYACKTGEIDIVAEAGDYLVFVEVKLRTNLNNGYPREAVGYQKQSKIKRCAERYIAEKKLYSRDCRFDVIEIVVTDKTEITHITDAF